MNKINDMLVKRGKPMIHQGVERNSKGNMERIIKKIQFMKKLLIMFIQIWSYIKLNKKIKEHLILKV